MKKNRKEGALLLRPRFLQFTNQSKRFDVWILGLDFAAGCMTHLTWYATIRNGILFTELSRQLTTPENTPMSQVDRLSLVISQIRFAREYTLSLLNDLSPEDWFRQPAGGVSHLAWQIGHLAMAQYGLCLFRMRGRAEVDLELMSSSFRKKFSKGTTPDPDPVANPSIAEIRGVFDRVFEQTMLELPSVTESQLDETVDMPYAAYPTKFGGLLFCSHHEMLHAGQIGLLRRLIGKTPVR